MKMLPLFCDGYIQRGDIGVVTVYKRKDDPPDIQRFGYVHPYPQKSFPNNKAIYVIRILKWRNKNDNSK